MQKLVILYDDIFLTHKSPFTHPENPTRLEAIMNKLNQESFLENVVIIKPKQAAEDKILSVHTVNHIDYVRSSIKESRVMLDEDTYAIKESWDAALTAAGSVIDSVDLVMDKNYQYTFCAIRPPGHHAESNRPMGFCLFNNVAIGAKYGINKYNLNRVAIIDWDVHHGNGTQEIFYCSPEVYYFSLHQYPLYPSTGTQNEIGENKGKNFTLNFPLPAYTKGEMYIKIFSERIIPELTNYKPQLIIISAGFDAHKDDPLANMLLDEHDYSGMTKAVKRFAASENVPIISVLEGGYNLNALAKSVYEHLKVLNS